MSRTLPFSTSPEQLLEDLLRAYRDARRHKRGKAEPLRFERGFERELVRLRDEILSGRYRPGPCRGFIIHDPKMREILASHFRDRVVHHLLYNYIYPLLAPGFIRDSYSCIEGRGSHDGIRRLGLHLEEVSRRWSRPCYVLKMDIRGYFMSIDRERLLSICLRQLEPFCGRLDFPLVRFLLEVTLRSDPVAGCVRLGRASEWARLPAEKSLFLSPPGCGLPIGNLTSQLLSNVYLHGLDRFVTEELGCRHYGRYVDDFYLVASSKAELRALVPRIRTFLWEELGLRLNEDKTLIRSAYMGTEFLGAFVKPFRSYVGRDCLRRMEGRFSALPSLSAEAAGRSINSYLGISSHYAAYRIRERWLAGPLRFAFAWGYFRKGVLRYRLFAGIQE